MTKNETKTVKEIIENLISVSKNYDEYFEEKKLVGIVDYYNSSNCNITKSYYPEINNLIDQQITKFLFDVDARQQVQEYIGEVSPKVSELSDNRNFKSLINYIGSYIENHIVTYSSILDGIETTAKVQKDYNKELIDAKENLIKSRDTIDNLMPNLLTVLSILISIVIAVVIVYITVFLEPNDNTKTIIYDYIQARFAQYVLSVHVVGDLFFMMMFMIARLTNRSILMTCSHFEWKPEIPDEHKDSYLTEFHRFACADCCTDCSFMKKLQRKSAYILYFNILMFALYAILYFWWLLSYYINSGTKFIFSSDFWLIMSFVIIILLSIAFSFFIRFFRRKKEENKRINEIINTAFKEIRENNPNVSLKKAIRKKKANKKYDLDSVESISQNLIELSDNEKITCIKYYVKKEYDNKKYLMYRIETKNK